MFLAAAAMPAKADMLTLGCTGTMMVASRLDTPRDRLISIEVIIDLAARTVQASELGGVIPITDVKANEIIFKWTEIDRHQIMRRVSGIIGRISGDLGATTWRGYGPRIQGAGEVWNLKCRPAPAFRERPLLRMF